MHGQAEVGGLTSGVSQRLVGSGCKMLGLRGISWNCSKITHFAIENHFNMSIILPSLKYGTAFDTVWKQRKLTGEEYDL